MWERVRDVTYIGLLLFICLMSLNMGAAVRASADKAQCLVEEDEMVEYEWWIRIGGVCIKAKASGQTAQEAVDKMVEAHAIHQPVADCP
jgi:hypothetical protein